MSKFSDWIKNVKSPATMITDVVVGSVQGLSEAIEPFIETPEKKAEMQKVIMQFQMEATKAALAKDQSILSDRASARQMAGIHGKLQSKVAVIFLIAFFVFLIADIIFIGWIAARAVRPDMAQTEIPDWIQMLITNTLTGILAYMVSMVKEIIGFLFGGSAGGDEAGANMAETMRLNSPKKP
jgi:hypothetical protein